MIDNDIFVMVMVARSALVKSGLFHCLRLRAICRRKKAGQNPANSVMLRRALFGAGDTRWCAAVVHGFEFEIIDVAKTTACLCGEDQIDFTCF